MFSKSEEAFVGKLFCFFVHRFFVLLGKLKKNFLKKRIYSAKTQTCKKTKKPLR